MFEKQVGGADGQRAVHVNGHVGRKAALVAQLDQAVQDFLGAFHGEGGDDHLFAPAMAVGDCFGQFIQGVGLPFMVAVAVGGFHKQPVRRGGLFRVRHQQRAGSAQIPEKTRVVLVPSSVTTSSRNAAPDVSGMAIG